MTPPARRDGTPDQKIYLSKAKPARKQHVQQPNSEHNDGEGIRLQKVLAQAGVASRRMSEKLIDNLQYFILNKPYGVQSTMHDDLGRPCIGDIIGEKIDAGQRLFHVGRLDAATEGLLLLTNDGELANRLTHPTYEIAKTYLATVIGEANRRLIRTLKNGIELDDGPARADYVQIVDVHDGKSLIRVELHEGRKHIVRRMLKEVGYPVERLVRTRIHTVQLGDQTPGTIRALNDAELSSLYKAVGM